MDERKHYSLHKNILLKTSDIFEEPDKFLKVDEILVDVNFPKLPGIGNEIVVLFPSIKQSFFLSDQIEDYKCYHCRFNIDKNDGSEDVDGWIYKMVTIVSDRKDVLSRIFERIQILIEHKDFLNTVKLQFDQDIWKIGTKQDKLNYKLKKIKNIT